MFLFFKVVLVRPNFWATVSKPITIYEQSASCLQSFYIFHQQMFLFNHFSLSFV